MLKSRLRLEWGLITLLATILIGGALYSGVTRRIDNLLYDFVAAWRAPPPSDRIILVEIDNESLKTVGKWPWGRDVHAQLIEQLNKATPQSIAYDMLFVEPGDTEQDERLAAAVAAHGNVLLPLLYSTPGLNGADYDIVYPIPPLASAAARVGTVNLLFDTDGLVRRAQLETRMPDGRLSHLMEQTYRSVTAKPSRVFAQMSAPSDHAVLGADEERDSVLIPFLQAGSFRHVSFGSVLRGEVPASFLKDKIVLVGATADGLGDRYPVPALVGSTMSGVEIQANLLNGLLHDRFIHAAPFWVSLLASVVPVWLLMLIFLYWRPKMNLLVSIGFILLVLAVVPLAATLGGYWIPPGPALLGLLIVYPLWGWRRLEALSSFVFQEAQSLKSEPGLSLVGAPAGGGLDSVAEEALQLRAVIGELRGVRRFMSDVVYGFPDAICVVDSDLRVTLANAAAQNVLGDDIKGASFAERLDQAAPGTSLASEEMTLADGRTFLIRKVPLTNAQGEEAGSIIRLADISRLREADKERAEVLEFLSHDMRAPQAAIITLLEANQGADTEDAVWDRVGENARRTLKLVDDFVQTARVSSAELVMQEVNIASAMAEAIDQVWPQAQRKAIQITSEGMEIEAFVLGDHGALVRAFTNLIDNAVKYSPPETAVQCRVALDEAERVNCIVSDQGPGLPLARKGDLFARFGARGDKATTGTGLGLAYVKKVVDRHGGTIDWASDSGQGTRFKLSFPVTGIGDLDDAMVAKKSQ